MQILHILSVIINGWIELAEATPRNGLYTRHSREVYGCSIMHAFENNICFHGLLPVACT